MKHAKPKTNAQVRRMFGLAKPKADASRMDVKNYLENVAEVLTADYENEIDGKEHLSDLTFDEANKVIKWLGGDPFPTYGHSRRMENYRKQAAGVKSIETDAQLKLIRELAAQRNIGDDGLGRLATRMRLPWPPNTTEQGNKLTEALKAMIARDKAPTPLLTKEGCPAPGSPPEHLRAGWPSLVTSRITQFLDR